MEAKTVRLWRFDILEGVNRGFMYAVLPVVVILWFWGRRVYSDRCSGFWRSVVRSGFWGLVVSIVIGFFLWMMVVRSAVTICGFLTVRVAPWSWLVPLFRVESPFGLVWFLVILVMVYVEIFSDLSVNRCMFIVRWMVRRRTRNRTEETRMGGALSSLLRWIRD